MTDMNISEELMWRGLIKDTTFQDLKWLDTPRTFYIGIDAGSANSLTIGNLAAFLVAKRLKLAGWKAVLLVGGATSMIGDPGGKDEERQLKSREEISANVAGIESQIKTLFNGLEFQLVDNYDWLSQLTYLDFLRDIGKQYAMSELMQRDFVTARMREDGPGISYAEFSYSLIQGYDFWHLYKTFGVEMQIGGSDQWGNMLSGVPLIRKKENVEVQAMSIPLVINRATGKKFGKSESGAVWLDPAKTSPLQFYQFWINTDDEGLETYLKVYTELDKSAIEQAVAEHLQDPSARKGQKLLAFEVTKLVHGEDKTKKAEQATEVITGSRSIADLEPSILDEVKNNLVSQKVKLPFKISDSLVSTGLTSSKSEAHRLIESKAIYINGQTIDRDEFSFEDFITGVLLLRRGKAYKDTALIELEN